MQKRVVPIWGRLLDIFFPRRCPVCYQPVDRRDTKYEGLCCSRCYVKLSFVTGATCFRCGKPIGKQEQEYCGDCLTKKRNFDTGVALLHYSSPISSRLMAKIKYENGREYADFLAMEMVRRHGDRIRSWKAECIIPVPIHSRKKKIRGYNQAEVLAQRLGRLLDIPVEAQALCRKTNTKALKELTGQERFQNLKDAFVATPYAREYRRVILLDDIFTTGSTAYMCTKSLREAGVKKIFLVNFCIGSESEAENA